MAEATDLPGAAEPAKAGALPGPAWPGEGVTLSPAPPPPPAESAYRPLSGLALAAFILAALYALAVTLGGVVAFVTHHPWWLLILTVLAPPFGLVVARAAGARGAGPLRWAGLSLLVLYAGLGVFGLVNYSNTSPWMLPGWAILLPLAAAVLAWLARGRIRDSEGTLGGAALASWGLGLSLFFGLTYVAYYAGAYVAVRQQAESFSRQWLELLAQDKLPEAFALTMSARDRPNPPTREELERRTMTAPTAGAAQMGPSGYGQFVQIDFVRALRLGGPGTRIRPLGILEWTYKSGTPEVKTRYRVDTDVVGFEMIVTALGTEAKAGEGGGRQWQVVVQSTGRPNTSEFTLTPKGKQLMDSYNAAAHLAQRWMSQISRHEWDQAYLDTLPPAERDRAHQQREACDPALAAAAGLGVLGGNPQARAYLAGRARLFSGELINDSPSVFWAPTPRVRAEVPARVRQALRPDATSGDHFEMAMTRMPEWARDGDRFRFLCDSQMMMVGPDGGVAFMVDTQVEVEGDAQPDGFPAAESWRVHRLDLLRGRTGGGPMRAPGGRGMQPRRPR